MEIQEHSFVSSAVDGLRVAIHEKHITLKFNAQPCPTMSVDSDRLQQVLWNLLSNSIKFTPQYGHVDVDLKTDGQVVEVRVADDRQGFSREFQSCLFQRFQQADRKARKQGLGLGLAIARHIVEMHGGTISGHSRGLKGATFIVRLPVFAGAELSLESLGRANTA
jgi:signal transduction histidine kinase